MSCDFSHTIFCRRRRMRKWSRGAQYSSSYRRVLIGTAPAANSLVQHTHCFLFVFGAPLISAVLSEIVFRTRAEYGNYVSFVYVLNGMVKMKYIFFFRLRYLYILQASWTSLMLVLVFFFCPHTRQKRNHFDNNHCQFFSFCVVGLNSPVFALFGIYFFSTIFINIE